MSIKEDRVAQRKSNLELLRIIAMSMVLLCHYTYTRDILDTSGGGG